MIRKSLSSKIFTIICLFSFCCSYSKASTKSTITQKTIVVIVPSYNTEKWCHRTLESILFQHYDNYRVIFIDDSSIDNTLHCIHSFLQSRKIHFTSITFDDSHVRLQKAADSFKKQILNAQPQKWTIVHNKNRCLALENIYRGIHSCPDDVIIALIDGDDWLAHPNVFREINQIYSKKNVWLTHGSFTEYPSFHSSSKSNWAWSTPIPTNIIQRNLFRNYFVPAHLRTFYAALFKKIDIKDLLYKDNFLATTGDVAIMIPMIEMAGERHHFMRKINYIYNTSNALNDRKIKPKLQEQLVHFIRKKQRYTRIYSLFS